MNWVASSTSGLRLVFSWVSLEASLWTSREKKTPSAAVDHLLRGNVDGVPITWESIARALESSHVGEAGQAKNIRQKYCELGTIQKGKTLTVYQEGLQHFEILGGQACCV